MAMSGPLTFLVASPHLRGTFFEDSVMLLLEHDQEGAMGLMINRPLPNTVADLLPDFASEQTNTWLGGPVDPAMGWCLYQNPTGLSGEIRLLNRLFVSSSLEVLQTVIATGQPYRLVLGYAGWAAGQLTDEAREGTWLWVEQDSARLLWDVPAAQCWQAALDVLGVNAATIMPGGAQA